MTKSAADWLKSQRTRAGYPDQSSFAAAIGTSRSAVGNWESGRGRPSAELIPVMSQVLSVAQAELVERFGIRMEGSLPAPMPAWWSDLEALISGLDARLQSLEGELAAQRVAQLTSDREQIDEVIRRALRDELDRFVPRQASGQSG